MTLADGTLTLQANTTPNSRTTTGAVTGGTGAYANARGVFVSDRGPVRLPGHDHARGLSPMRSRTRAARRRHRSARALFPNLEGDPR